MNASNQLSSAEAQLRAAMRRKMRALFLKAYAPFGLALIVLLFSLWVLSAPK